MTDRAATPPLDLNSDKAISETGKEVEYNVDHKPNIRDYITETRPFWKVPHLLLLNFAVLIVTLTSTTNGYDGSMLNGLQSLTRWQEFFNYPDGQRLGALSNGGIFGCIFSFAFCSFISDRFGRKAAIYLGEAIAILGAVLQGLSTNYGFFFISRFFIGFGSGIAAVASPTLISEIAYPLHREVATFAYNICWYLGATIAAAIVLGTRLIESDFCWRIPSYLQGLVPLIQILLLWVVPESPRFLIAKGRLDEAEKIIKKYHTGNSTDPRDLEFVQFELKEIEAAIEAEKIQSQTKYSDFITKKTFRKRLFLVIFTPTMMQLSGNGLVSYYLNKVLNSIGITEEREQLVINVCLMVYNFVCCFAICFTSNAFKRRTLFITCVVGMLCCYIVWTALSAVAEQQGYPHSLSNGVLAMIFLYYFFYNVGINGLPFLYLTEILPYSHRAKGINIFQLWTEIVLVYNGYVNPIAMDAISWKYYIVYCCILFVECWVVYFFYPETSGRTLEEVAEVFGDATNIEVAAQMAVMEKRNSFEHVENA